MATSEMVIAALVMMAADSGEMESPADVDVMIHELHKNNYGDRTYRELMDALLDLRGMLQRRDERIPVPD